jgi:hypothetical protein
MKYFGFVWYVVIRVNLLENLLSQLAIFDNMLSLSEQLKQVLHFFTEHVLFLRIHLFVAGPHFRPIYHRLCVELACDKHSLFVANLLNSLPLEIAKRLRVVIMPQIGCVEDPQVRVSADLPDRDPWPTLALTEIVVAAPMYRGTAVWAAPVTLTDEALPHFQVLVGLVATLCEMYAREGVHVL